MRELLKRCGGVRPVPRRRNGRHLSLTEREEISRGLAAGDSLRSIARGLGRAPSTISREVAKRGGRFVYPAFRIIPGFRSPRLPVSAGRGVSDERNSEICLETRFAEFE
ncbi:helix-turn-helix domain-containing protein [Nocardia amamiensis]|uniref:Helix-turn-helix domain-containing protein n=1 Tax=Nocardia amamiensis TaxID=404578 RepID=A0ABS0D3C7_9NOCA|nr:helix-turn-helix domain-containing protein [Nocardia amamiensis]